MSTSEREQEDIDEAKVSRDMARRHVRQCSECDEEKPEDGFRGSVCADCLDKDYPCPLCTGKMSYSRLAIGFCEECRDEVEAEKRGESRPVLASYDELLFEVRQHAINSFRAMIADADLVPDTALLVLGIPATARGACQDRQLVQDETIAKLSVMFGYKFFCDGTPYVGEPRSLSPVPFSLSAFHSIPERDPGQMVAQK